METELCMENGRLSRIRCCVQAEKEIEYVVSIDYMFAQTEFDALEVQIPEDVEERGLTKNITFMVNGEYFLRASTTIEENMDVAAHFEDMKEGFDDILYEHYLMGYDETIVMIDGWYYDETCTQKINFSTLSFEEYLALETVYGKFSMADGYALIVESYERIYDHSEAYQVVFTRGLSEDRNSSIRLYEIGEGNTNIYDRGGYDHMTVNGVECESFTYESGTVYIVVLKEKITDEDRSIFEWFI